VMQASGFGIAGSWNTVIGNSIDPLLGVGVAWHLPAHVTLRGEYTRFINVGDRGKTGEINIDLFNVGVTYSFRLPSTQRPRGLIFFLPVIVKFLKTWPVVLGITATHIFADLCIRAAPETREIACHLHGTLGG
jgi:hypothetical protein